jgi:glycosyltransferase involved in cell wall biosynthesis
LSTTEVSSRGTITDGRVSLPLVSVVIPTRNRASHLPYLFAALGSQTYPAARMELVVVDNESTDGTAELVAEWAEALPSPLRYHRKENDGQTASRNVGSSLARGDVLAFTDSDCIPDPHWIANAVRHLEQADVVAGPMVGLMSSTDGVAMLQFKSVLHDDGTYPTGNLFISRDRFQAVGGFDERFGLFPWGNPKAGEDTDLVWRARRSGADVTFADDVVVGHQPAPPPRLTQSLLVPVVVQIFPYLVRSIPELRDVKFHRRYFLDKQHM